MTYSTDDGRTVAPRLLSAVLRAMGASFRRETVLDAFASPDATLYSWAVRFRFGVPVRFDGGKRYRAEFTGAALRKALDYQSRVLQGGA